MQESLYSALAACLDYPSSDWPQRLRQCRQSVDQCATPAATDRLDRFLTAVDPMTVSDAQELFTRTFDHNPAHALEIGWHLFGEDYHRGALLVRLRQELRRHTVPESSELPDHLTHVLTLLGKMSPPEAVKFAEACVLPALAKLTDGLQRDGSPYLDLIQCIVEVIQHSCQRGFEEINDGHTIQLS